MKIYVIFISLIFIACKPSKICLYEVSVSGSSGSSAKTFHIDSEYNYCTIRRSTQFSGLQASMSLVMEAENSEEGMNKIQQKLNSIPNENRYK